jgi:hypothetical protein
MLVDFILTSKSNFSFQAKRKARNQSPTFLPQKSSKKLGAEFKELRSTPEN